ncbi:unnamed protein product, partial [Ilex paraguariensis]
MPSSKALVVVTSLWLLILNIEAAPSFVYHTCINTTTYTPNSTFQSNLNLLLSVLSSNSAHKWFYTATVGDDASSLAIGLFLCRGDVTIEVCNDCVVNAGKDLVQRCPRDEVAYIWYDECMLRYDNRSFVGSMGDAPWEWFWYGSDVTEPNHFAQVLGGIMDGLATRASSNQPLDDQNVTRFATGEANFSSLLNIYGLAQCTPDLSGIDCYRCLRLCIGVLAGCCNGKPRARVLHASCNLRYDMFPFYRSNMMFPFNSSTARAPPLTRATSSGGEGKISKHTFIALVAPIVASLALLAIGLCLLVGKQRRKYNSLEKEN